ncbi:MAG TPA: VWA domain-containing protein [Vicinamibacterales bacterium]
MQRSNNWRKLSLAALAAAVFAGGAVGAQNAPAGQQPAQDPSAQNPPAQQQPQRQIIRRQIDVITTDVIVRDNRGQFVADLKKDEFEVYEDGVKQEVVSFVLTHGGRVYNQTLPAPPKPQPGIILPPPRPTNDAAGRIFVIFVDDLHLDFRNTGRIRELFKTVASELIHEGDMFAVVSSGPASIEIPLTYDRRRLDEALKKVTGGGLRPNEILDQPDGAQGPPEIRYRAHTAMSTVYEILKNLEQVHNRRKAFVYISNGYDFNPFVESRRKAMNDRYGIPNDATGEGGNDVSYSDVNPFSIQNNRFAEADLVAELAELTRQANRANATLYTIDPRGLVGGPDLDEKIDMVEWQNHVTSTQNSLRTLAELTGGIAVVNQNDFKKALQRIDAETSDYYMLGYYSNNPDPTRKRRRIEVKVTRPGMNVFHKTFYTLRPRDANGDSR